MAINNNNSTSRSQLQTILNNPYAIRQEIQRFESVHPSIYAIYDLIELIPDVQVATQIREHIVNIEGKRSNPIKVRSDRPWDALEISTPARDQRREIKNKRDDALDAITACARSIMQNAIIELGQVVRLINLHLRRICTFRLPWRRNFSQLFTASGRLLTPLRPNRW